MEESDLVVSTCNLCGEEVDPSAEEAMRLSCRTCDKSTYHTACFNKYMKSVKMPGKHDSGWKQGGYDCPRGKWHSTEMGICKGKVSSSQQIIVKNPEKKAKRIQEIIEVANMVAESTRQALKPIPIEERLLLPLKALPPKPPKIMLPGPNKFFNPAVPNARTWAASAVPAVAEPEQEREIPGMTYDRPKPEKRPPPAAAANFEKALAAANNAVQTKVPAKVPNAWTDLHRTAEIVALATAATQQRAFGNHKLQNNNYSVLMGADPSDIQAMSHDQGGAGSGAGGNNGARAARNAADATGYVGSGEEQQLAEVAAGWVVQDKRQKGRLEKPPAQHKPHPQPTTPTVAVRIQNSQFPDEQFPDEQYPEEQYPNEQFADEEYPANVEDYGETEIELQLRLYREVEQSYPQMAAPQPPFSGASRPIPQPPVTTPTPPSFNHTLPVQGPPGPASSNGVSSARHGSSAFHGGVNLGGVDRMTGRQDTPEERAWHSMGEEEQMRFLQSQQEDWNEPGVTAQQGDGWTILDRAPDNTTSPTSANHQAHTTAATATAPLTAANLLLAQQQQDRAAMGGRPEARPTPQVATPVYTPRVIALQQTQQERGHPVVIQQFPATHAALVLQQQQLEQLAEQKFQQQQIQQMEMHQQRAEEQRQAQQKAFEQQRVYELQQAQQRALEQQQVQQRAFEQQRAYEQEKALEQQRQQQQAYEQQQAYQQQQQQQKLAHQQQVALQQQLDQQEHLAQQAHLAQQQRLVQQQQLAQQQQAYHYQQQEESYSEDRYHSQPATRANPPSSAQTTASPAYPQQYPVLNPQPYHTPSYIPTPSYPSTMTAAAPQRRVSAYTPEAPVAPSVMTHFPNNSQQQMAGVQRAPVRVAAAAVAEDDDDGCDMADLMSLLVVR